MEPAHEAKALPGTLATGPGPVSRLEDADVETSSDGYAKRFAGPIGAFLLEVQTRATLAALGRWPGARVLDVGGGHAQTVGPLTAAGHDVTVFGSSPVCSARVQPWLDRGAAHFASGDLLALPFESASFDVVLSYRLLPHVSRWRELLAELTRVAARAVVIDYPTSRSVNAVAPAFFGLKRGIEGDTRTYTVFRDAEIVAALRQLDFRLTGRWPQFFFPMALHRALRAVPVSRALEACAGGTGLRRLLGSPVILRSERG
jgi:2-polyprenyl-3-methyl-5-hydroxy-6-metoxy-1,4-benzoquinol methylase